MILLVLLLVLVFSGSVLSDGEIEGVVLIVEIEVVAVSIIDDEDDDDDDDDDDEHDDDKEDADL